MLMAPLWVIGLEYFYIALTGKREKQQEDQDSGPWWF
jgi:hypothetical protein